MAVKTAAQQKAYEDQIMAGWNKSKANVAPSQANPALVQQHQQAAEAFKQANWQNGGTTVTPTTGAQNLNAVLQQPGNTAGPSANIQGIQNQALVDTNKQAGNPPPAVYQPPTGNVDTSGMKQALSQYANPAATGLTFDQAKSQVSGQIDPMFARALEALQAQKHQDQLNGSELGSARGGAHSGLAADLQNKVAIGAAGKAADLDATRQTQIAEMAQALVNRGQDNDFRNKQQALAEYLGLNQLDLQRQGQTADYTGIFGGQQTLQSKSQDQNYGLGLAGLTGNINGQKTIQSQQLDSDNAYRDKVFDYNVSTDSRDFDYKKAQDSWSQTFAKEQYSDEKAARLWEQTFKTKSFEQDMKEAAASRGLQWASLNQRDKEFLADQEYRDKTFTANQDQLKIGNQLNQDQLNWEKDPLNPSNTSKTPTSSLNLDDYKGFINQNFYKEVPVDPSNPLNKATTKQLDKDSTYKYVLALHLPDSDTEEMLRLYQIPTK